MRLNLVVRTIGSGGLLYVVMAACAADSHRVASGDAGSTTSTAGGTSASGSLVDVLISPVPDANAAPETTTESCDKLHGTLRYAEHLYPGVLAADLATVRVMLNDANVMKGAGYTGSLSPATWVKDGAVAVQCASSDSSVVFVRGG